MEGPNKNAEEETVGERSVVSPGTAVEHTASQGTGKHKKRSKKRSKPSITTGSAKPADGGAETSAVKPKKTKHESKTDIAAAEARLESQPEPPPAQRAQALAEKAAPAEVAASAAAAPVSAVPDALAQRLAQVSAGPQARSSHPDHEIDNSIPEIERRRPNFLLLPIIGSVVIICLLAAVVVGMMIARTKQVRVSGTTISSGPEMTTASIDDAATTVDTSTEQSDTTPVVTSDEAVTSADESQETLSSTADVDAQTSM
ncbi:uncharacterized protein LOC144107013 [Amblyomma americanum]